MRISAITWIGLLFLLVAGCEGTPEYPEREPPAGFLDDVSHVAAGQALFARHCSRCHARGGEGAGMPDAIARFSPPAAGFTAREYVDMDPAYLYWRIEAGKNVEPYRSRGSTMPAWGPYFSEEQIWQLVAYIQNRARR